MSTKPPKSSDGPTRARKRGSETGTDAGTAGRKSRAEFSNDAVLETSETTALPWATMARLTFLEESIFWTDGVNRRDLIERFGISEQQASGDLTRYQ